MSGVKSMRAPELAAMIRDRSLTPGKDYVVVDVRDDDYIGGHIPGAVNLPSHTLGDPNVIEAKAREFASVPKLIFHCALSQQRGPKAAMRFASIMGPDRTSEIYVLIGGFSQWQQQYRNEPDLLEGYDAKVWSDEWWN
ncbi:Rhodanese-like domain-containing protein [Catenaria anguillulae PL171]|uniref:Rhodanese-like domain-containing protein n=1 Tax=Catenaria anguillulae PL171 TaxID=765915 RepID=A0A1Y2I2H8_9FUNG|nr:Rhodanese-like domain-containing protein [Catenaria anguillulae PL171]